MRVRAVAAVALSGALALGLSGCNVIGHAPAATLDQYAPSDGAYANFGALSFHSLMVIAENGDLGNLVGTVVNNSSDDIDYTLQWNVDGTWHSIDLTAAANSRTALGYGDGASVQLAPVLNPGDILDGAVVVDGSTSTILIPVLDEALGEYKGLLPVPAPVVTEPAVTDAEAEETDEDAEATAP